MSKRGGKTQSTKDIPTTPSLYDYRPGAPRPTPSFISRQDMKTQPMTSNSQGSIGFEEGDFSEDEDSEEDPTKACLPCPQSQQDFVENVPLMPSVTSLLDYNIFEGMVSHQDTFRSETDAFIPVGGMVAPEKKRKEFMDYLKKTGFISAISQMMLSLWDEDPWPEIDSAVEFLAKCLGYKLTIHDDIAENATYSNVLRVKIQKLEIENDWMRRHLDNYELSETPIPVVDPTTFPPIIYQKEQGKQRQNKPKHANRHQLDNRNREFGSVGSLLHVTSDMSFRMESTHSIMPPPKSA